VIEVLYVDNHLLAVAKPAGVAVVPDESGDESSFDAAKAWIAREFAKPGAVWLGVVHRLDRPVSGVVLFARTSKAAARLSAQFREQRARKTYWAVSRSTPPQESGAVEQWLVKDADSNRVRVAAERSRGAQLAVTHWRVAGRAGELVHIDLEPRTGRPHQLRVALASLGCPLLGDLKYGAREPLPDQSVALHAAALEVEHPTKREPLLVQCPAPDREWWAWRRERA
jgi:23S rRNA pseudouridine1911/1915/1917 synthase